MSSTIIFLLFIIIISNIMFIYYHKYEKFDPSIGYLPSIATRTICPTRNMSYDRRKNVIIPRKDWPVLNSTLGPLYPQMCN